MDYSAYVAYGVHIPVNPYRSDDTGLFPDEQVDKALSVPTVKAACPDVGHIQAGDYDRDRFFLVTKCEEAEPGSYTRIGRDTLGRSTSDDELSWDRQILHLIEIMGWSGLADGFEPGWFVISDCS